MVSSYSGWARSEGSWSLLNLNFILLWREVGPFISWKLFSIFCLALEFCALTVSLEEKLVSFLVGIFVISLFGREVGLFQLVWDL